LSKKAKDIIYSVLIVLLIAAFFFFCRPTYISADKDIANSVTESYFGKLVTVDDYSYSHTWLYESRGSHKIFFDYTVNPKSFALGMWQKRGEADASGNVNGSGSITYYKIGNVYFTGVTIDSDN
jgi:hypothetical protein